MVHKKLRGKLDALQRQSFQGEKINQCLKTTASKKTTTTTTEQRNFDL